MSLDYKDKKKGIGLRFAINGIFLVWRSERNFRIHILFTLLVILFSWYFQLSKLEWILVCFCIGFVLALEMINSAVELLIDHMFPEYHNVAGRIKDILAGSVLIAAISSAIIGMIIFAPKILNMLI
jgi:diacylglycerol kinase